VVTFLIQRLSGSVLAWGHLSLAGRVGNAMLSYWRYVGKTLWPAGLAPLYPLPPAGDVDVSAAPLAAAGLAVVTALALRQARRRPWLTVGWLWYLGTLVPVIGLVQAGMQAYADRYTYIPVIGLSIALVWGVGEWAAGSRTRRVAMACASLLALAGLGVATARQVALWKDTWTLFTHTLAVTSDNAVAHKLLGYELLRAGQLEPAMTHFEAALRLIPSYPDVHEGMGEALSALGRYDEGIAHYTEVLRVAPDYADTHGNLGCALAARGRYDEAIANFRIELRTRETAALHHNLGLALATQGRMDEAIPEYQAALRLDPGEFASLVPLATALAAQGRLGESEARLREALKQASTAGEIQHVESYLRQLETHPAGQPLHFRK